MPNPDAAEWNHRYERDPRQYGHKTPRPLLVNNLHLLASPGLALDIACGASPGGIFLARRGWRLVGLDVAQAGLRLAQAGARKEALPLSLAVMDLSEAWLPAEHFDLILDFYFLMRPLLPTLEKALKPGGLLFFETFLWQETEQGRREFFPQTGELRAAFPESDLLYYEELPRRRDPQDQRRLVSMIVRKPLKGERR